MFRRFIVKFILLAVGASTIYTLIFGRNRVTERDRLSVALAKCFSAEQNCKALYQSSSRTYPFLHFLKIVFMFFANGAHLVMFYYMFPNYETEQLEVAYRPWAFELHWTAILNAFFMVSGFLRAFHFDFSPELDNSVLFFLRSLVLKWLRLVPANGLLIAWFYFVIPYLEDGPISKYLKQTELQHCTSNWWINMLALQNIVNQREMCHPHSWYIAVDIQLYVIGTVLQIIFKKHQKCGIYLMIVTFLYSALHMFVKIYWNTSYRHFVEYFTLDILHYPETYSIFFSIHTVTFYRIGPYLIGYVTALATKSLMEKGYNFSSMQSILLPFFLSILALGIQLSGLTFLIVGRQREPLKEALFGALQPTLFVLPIASLICIYFVSGFGILHEFLDHRLYVPLGKLSYSVYLVAIGVQSYHVFNQRRSLSRFNKTEMYWWMMGDIAFILPTALLFYVTSEGPINNLTNLYIKPFLNKYLSRRRSQTSEKKTNIENSESNPTAEEYLEAKKASFTHVTDFAREYKDLFLAERGSEPHNQFVLTVKGGLTEVVNDPCLSCPIYITYN